MFICSVGLTRLLQSPFITDLISHVVDRNRQLLLDLKKLTILDVLSNMFRISGSAQDFTKNKFNTYRPTEQ